MPTPLQGTTLFLGDSITVNTHPFVQVNGQKQVMAEVGKTADWLLTRVRVMDKDGLLKGVQNAVMLIGTNDVGGPRSAEAIWTDIRSTWEILRHSIPNLFAMTVPPFKGYKGYAGNFAAINDKRHRLNDLILAPSVLPKKVLRMDAKVTAPGDTESLALFYDDGDHLHLRKPALGALIQEEFGPLTVPLSPQPGPGPEPSPSPVLAPTNLVPYVVLGCIFVGVAAFTLTRKHHHLPHA